MTGIGPVAVRQPRVRDREAAADDPDRIRFRPAILPPYVRRSKSVESLLPILYLKGVSTGDFSEGLAALFGKDAVGLSASTIGRLKEVWHDEHAQWQKAGARSCTTTISCARRDQPSPPNVDATREQLEEDEGLLLASEVAQLELDADWIVLSACNTAAGEKGDA